MPMTSHTLTITILCSTVFACGEGGDDKTLRERMADGESFRLAPPTTTLSMNVRYWDGPNWRSSRLDLIPTAGEVRLSSTSDGQVILEEASLELADIDLGVAAALTRPNDLLLTHVNLRTEEPHECNVVDWASDDEACSANVPVTLVFSYQLLGRGLRGAPSAMPIATDLGVAVDQRASDLSVSLDARTTGTLGWWDGELEFRDFTFSATGASIEAEEGDR